MVQNPHVTIAVLIGSLRRDSFNRRLARMAIAAMPPAFDCTILDIGVLPPYNQDDDDNPARPVRQFKAQIGAAQGLLFVTPEYNRSIPGVLKNAIDHASRPFGYSVWTGKPAGILGVSPGATGTAMAQQHLRNVLAGLDVPTLGLPEIFLQEQEGRFKAPGASDTDDPRACDALLRTWISRYVAWVERFAA